MRKSADVGVLVGQTWCMSPRQESKKLLVWSDEIEPEAVAFMSPRDMRKLGMWPGDMVQLRTRRGAVEIKVRGYHLSHVE